MPTSSMPIKELARRLEWLCVRIVTTRLAKGVKRGALTFSFDVTVLMALDETSFNFLTLPGKRKS